MNKFQRNYRLVYTVPPTTTEKDAEVITISSPISVEFDITRNTFAQSNTATFRLHNLAPSTRDKIEQEETTTQSQVVITVKEYRSIATKTVKVNAEKYAGRTASQNAITEQLGKAKGKEDLTSTLYRMTYGAAGK